MIRAVFFLCVLGLSLPLAAKECRSGWQASGPSLCIESSAQENVAGPLAAEVCEEKKARVCSTEEWVEACRKGLFASQGWEWTLTMSRYTSLTGRAGCEDLAYGELNPTAALRCCEDRVAEPLAATVPAQDAAKRPTRKAASQAKPSEVKTKAQKSKKPSP